MNKIMWDSFKYEILWIFSLKEEEIFVVSGIKTIIKIIDMEVVGLIIISWFGEDEIINERRIKIPPE